MHRVKRDAEAPRRCPHCGSSAVERDARGEQPLEIASRLALSVEEAADAVGVSERHLRSMLTRIPHTRLGGRVVIPVDSLRDWLREQARRQPSRVEEIVREGLRAVQRNEK